MGWLDVFDKLLDEIPSAIKLVVSRRRQRELARQGITAHRGVPIVSDVDYGPDDIGVEQEMIMVFSEPRRHGIIT